MIEKLKDKKLYVFISISLLFFGLYLKMEYATDTYNVFVQNNRAVILHFITSGRIITALWWGVMSILKLNNITIYIISTITALMAISLSQYKLYNIIKEHVKSVYIAVLISVIIILNIFSIELFMFIEKGILLLAVLFNVMAIENLIKYFKGEKKKIFLAVFYMILATFSYQGTVALFISLALIYILMYSKNIMDFIKKNMITAICYGIPALLNYIIVKFIFINNRTAGDINIKGAIYKTFNGIYNMLITTCGIIPKYVFLISLFLIVGLILYKIIKQKASLNEKVLSILKMIYIIVGSFLTVVLPYLLQNIDSIWIVPRSSYALASIIGILTLYLFINFDINMKLEKVIIFCSIIFLLIQFLSFQNITIDHYILNYMDKNISMQIKELMEKYEEEFGEDIKNIAIYTDKNMSYAYPDLFVSGDINVKAYAPDWCVTKIISYYVKDNLIIVEKDNDIENNFKKEDWNSFNEKQIVFTGSTMHICVF